MQASSDVLEIVEKYKRQCNNLELEFDSYRVGSRYGSILHPQGAKTSRVLRSVDQFIPKLNDYLKNLDTALKKPRITEAGRKSFVDQREQLVEDLKNVKIKLG